MEVGGRLDGYEVVHEVCDFGGMESVRVAGWVGISGADPLRSRTIFIEDGHGESGKRAHVW